MINIRNAREIELLRKSAQIVVETLNMIESRIRPGVRTGDLDAEIADFIRSKKGRPAFKGFHGYPANSCISVDEQVVHGIPGDRVLKEGEIVSVDVGVELNGYYGDAAKTFKVGRVSPEKERLIKYTKESLDLAVAAAVAGNYLSDIGNAVQKHVEAAGYSVVRDLVGHGLGTEMHEPPQIPNYGPPGKGPRLKPGMVFAIEPMVNMGSYQVYTAADEWTVLTSDGMPSAHFEHDIVITNGRPDILTAGL
ncbi:type I methionyl aminopeptidase [candidate division KSB1 bacterium]|nr:type I methionyl aminopeptidase [candidate division KSB1 bacterium]RQW03690.1 MAG: type I methionyl aminopeptidase [candidate division KSB1 bacterium]